MNCSKVTNPSFVPSVPLPEEALRWVPLRDPALGPRPACCVKLLSTSCLDVLVEYIDAVESLWGLPDDMKVRLAAALCARRKLSPQVGGLTMYG